MNNGSGFENSTNKSHLASSIIEIFVSMILTVCVCIIILLLQVHNIYEICKIITMSMTILNIFTDPKGITYSWPKW